LNFIINTALIKVARIEIKGVSGTRRNNINTENDNKIVRKPYLVSSTLNASLKFIKLDLMI
jgi:hypothetical protein